MERNIIQLNLPNCITIFTIAIVGYTIFSAGVAFVKAKMGS